MKINTSMLSVLTFLLWEITESFAQNQSFKQNCFSNSNKGTCEESRMKICGDFYACDLVINLDSPPKRIGFRNGDILFSSGGKTYGITNGSNYAEQVNQAIQPLGELVDMKGNTYFGGDGTTYVVEGGSGKEIEIITTGSNSYNQHALDTEANKLFVLSFDSDGNTNDRTGQIYAITTDPLDIVDNKIQAELVSDAGSRITALAAQGGLGTLLLGVKENDGGKLIILKKQRYDPCSQKESNKLALIKLIREMEVKIVEILDSFPEPMTRSKLLNKSKERELTTLSRENQRLKIEVSVTTQKLKMFSNTLLGLSNPFRRPLPPSPPPPDRRPAIPKSSYVPPSYPFTTRRTTTSSTPTKSEEPYDCLPAGDIEKIYLLELELVEFKGREKENQQRFDALLEQLSGIITNDE